MSNMYSIARQLQAPGVKTVATFNPARLSKTLRNMARKSIASGYHIGGWSSKTRDVRTLAIKLSGFMPSTFVAQSSDYISFYIPHPISEDNQSEIIGMFEADCTLQKMNFEETDSRYRPTRQQYYDTIDQRCKENIAKLKFADKEKARHMIVRTPKLKQQIAEVFLRERTIYEIAIAERVASLLDRDEEFTIPTDHAF